MNTRTMRNRAMIVRAHCICAQRIFIYDRSVSFPRIAAGAAAETIAERTQNRVHKFILRERKAHTHQFLIRIRRRCLLRSSVQF